MRNFLSFSHKKRLVYASVACICIGIAAYSSHLIITYYSTIAPIKKAPQEIPGSIITLKYLTEEHIIDYHNMFSLQVRQGMEFPEETNLGYTIAFLQRDLERQESEEMLAYAIYDNKDNRFIGAIEIREKSTEEYETHGQFGVWTNEAYWGGGRVQEATKLIAQAYFRLHPDFKSFNAHVRLWNKRSYFALKKAGFKEIGYVYENGKASKYVLEYYR
jgi:RimJ/RimL family protein N-acetyltransferase